MSKTSKKCIDYKRLWDGLRMFFMRSKRQRNNKELVDEMRVRELNLARHTDRAWRKEVNHTDDVSVGEKLDVGSKPVSAEGTAAPDSIGPQRG